MQSIRERGKIQAWKELFIGHWIVETKVDWIPYPCITKLGVGFELMMCEASDIAVRAVLGQKRNKVFYSIYFASKTLDATQENYTVSKK